MTWERLRQDNGHNRDLRLSLPNKAAIQAIQAKKVRRLSPGRRTMLIQEGSKARLKPGHMAQKAA
jgi:hypothetical protein